MRWLLLAAKTGHVSAQTNLGALYFNGEGVQVNLPEAVKWFEKAAKQNDPIAQFNLAILYAQGAGTRVI